MMVSSSNGKCIDEIAEQSGPASPPNGYVAKNHIPHYIRTSHRGLLDEETHKNKFLDFITALQSRVGFLKFKSPSRLSSSSSKFRQTAVDKDEISDSVLYSTDKNSSKRFQVPLVQKINWASLWELAKNWIKDPMNMALFAWMTCVAISGAILFLVMTGMLNGVLTKKSQRDTWFEVNNQILNALFALMCLYQHPKRFHHLVLLYRWRPEDIQRLRKIYCKNGTYKPNEWMHMMVVIVLLHVNCFAQYALCGLNWGYPRSKRPAIGVGVCLSVAIASPAIASVYNILSPLGRDYETEMDQEAQTTSVLDGKPARLLVKSLEKRYSFMSKEDTSVAENRPEWIGRLFDFWDDISLAYLSVFCSCCVFGWNMDRLGFGNMYVHIATFLLFCLAPFFIFNLAAVNIDNEAIREALGITGFVLCVLGLLYGGFWRIQMRKRFNLPANNFCCGKPAVTDCFQWLCCCACSLAQEVRTADYYDVVEDKFYLKQASGDNQLTLSPLPREIKSNSGSPYPGHSSPSLFAMKNSAAPKEFSGEHSPHWHLSRVHEESYMGARDNALKPPVFSVIQREDNPVR